MLACSLARGRSGWAIVSRRKRNRFFSATSKNSERKNRSTLARSAASMEVNIFMFKRFQERNVTEKKLCAAVHIFFFFENRKISLTNTALDMVIVISLKRGEKRKKRDI